ncbi:hypothetical protein PJF56_11905 [Roseofilum sp. BLCC_M91]|uniref:Uncharacterized protein n=1 Tax=Roseofilum halophilum BLCC-M91 TaxID=3022259 RepID=A0ABT7BLZ2_9CYAN|nr:hypothetical protein [Roseofilum halophilum]MDJ1179569.1 hypothetical protein [Roseofilum halophilum BLCC-M91]
MNPLKLREKGYQILVNHLGQSDTIRFIQYFTPSQGDYTEERHQFLDQTSLDEILLTLKKQPTDNSTQYDEIIDN